MPCFNMSQELNKSDMKCIKLQERNMALAKELAALKLVSDLNLDEDEIVKLAFYEGNVLRAHTLKALKKRKLSSSVVNEVDPTRTTQDTLKEPDVLPRKAKRSRESEIIDESNNKDGAGKEQSS
ncbi:hypothetical protein Tco_0685455 [Tanacetum coccineum]